jgi:hypothetical protein
LFGFSGFISIYRAIADFDISRPSLHTKLGRACIFEKTEENASSVSISMHSSPAKLKKALFTYGTKKSLSYTQNSNGQNDHNLLLSIAIMIALSIKA